MKNLFNIMAKIVEENMIAYKDDFYVYDKQILLDKNSSSNTFYWMVRETGTNIFDANKLKYKETFEYTDATYNLKYRKIKAIYKIQIEKRGRKYIYGSIEKISIKAFEDVVKKAKEATTTEKVNMILDWFKKSKFENEEQAQNMIIKKINQFEFDKNFIEKVSRQKNLNSIINILENIA